MLKCLFHHTNHPWDPLLTLKSRNSGMNHVTVLVFLLPLQLPPRVGKVSLSPPFYNKIPSPPHLYSGGVSLWLLSVRWPTSNRHVDTWGTESLLLFSLAHVVESPFPLFCLGLSMPSSLLPATPLQPLSLAPLLCFGGKKT